MGAPSLRPTPPASRPPTWTPLRRLRSVSVRLWLWLVAACRRWVHSWTTRSDTLFSLLRGKIVRLLTCLFCLVCRVKLSSCATPRFSWWAVKQVVMSTSSAMFSTNYRNLWLVVSILWSATEQGMVEWMMILLLDTVEQKQQRLASLERWWTANFALWVRVLVILGWLRRPALGRSLVEPLKAMCLVVLTIAMCRLLNGLLCVVTNLLGAVLLVRVLSTCRPKSRRWALSCLVPNRPLWLHRKMTK